MEKRVIIILVMLLFAASAVTAVECYEACGEQESACLTTCTAEMPIHKAEADYPYGCAELSEVCCCAEVLVEEQNPEQNETVDVNETKTNETEEIINTSSGRTGRSRTEGGTVEIRKSPAIELEGGEQLQDDQEEPQEETTPSEEVPQQESKAKTTLTLLIGTLAILIVGFIVLIRHNLHDKKNKGGKK